MATEPREGRSSAGSPLSPSTPGTPLTPALHSSRRAESSEEEASKPLPAGAKITLAAAIITPAVLVFVALRIVHLTAALGRAMRGETMIASGALTVLVLIMSGYFVMRSTDKTLYRVKKGNYLGQNFGLITDVTDSEIKLKEIVQDSAGDWAERQSVLPLLEEASKGDKK